MEAWNAWGTRAGDSLVDFGSPVTQAGVVGAAGSQVGEVTSAAAPRELTR